MCDVNERTQKSENPNCAWRPAEVSSLTEADGLKIFVVFPSSSTCTGLLSWHYKVPVVQSCGSAGHFEHSLTLNHI